MISSSSAAVARGSACCGFVVVEEVAVVAKTGSKRKTKIRDEEMNPVLELVPAESHEAVDRAARRLVERIAQIKGRTAASPEKTEP